LKQSMKRLRLYAGSRLIAKSLDVLEHIKVERESLGAAAAALKTALRETRTELEGYDSRTRLDIAVLLADLSSGVGAKLAAALEHKPTPDTSHNSSYTKKT